MQEESDEADEEQKKQHRRRSRSRSRSGRSGGRDEGAAAVMRMRMIIGEARGEERRLGMAYDSHCGTRWQLIAQAPP